MLGALAATALVSAAVIDVWRRLIPDAIPLVLLALGSVQLVALGAWADALLRVAIALTVFAAGLAAFMAGILGGGDVKLGAATALWVPPPLLLDFALVVALTGGLLAVAVLVVRQIRARALGHALAATASVPYGAAIAAGGCSILATTA